MISFPLAPFERLGPATAATPLVCAVAHAGRSYPAALLEASAVPLAVLEELEDRHADLLVRHAVAQGAVAIVARTARAWIDLNRGEDDLDPDLRLPTQRARPASARSRAGLGLLPRRIGGRALWRVAPSPGEAAARTALVHAPYHAAVAGALRDAVARHGFAVLLDCHSMPRLSGRDPARFVIGDRHGRSALPDVAVAIAAQARGAGHAVQLNQPYAGAYTVERHGRPDAGIQAVQLEVDRSLYLRGDRRTPAAAVDTVAALVARLGWAAVEAAARPGSAIAAE